MKILLLTAYFPPDTGSAAHLFYELGAALAENGHTVTVITNKPGYHAQGNLSKYKGKLVVKEKIKQMDIIRVASLRLPPRLMFGRALWQFGMALFFFLVALFVPRHDVTLLYSPPLTLGLSAWGIKMVRSIPFVLNVQDLFPQSIIDLGLLKNPVIISVFERMEQFVYRRADAITVHSKGNKQRVVGRGAEEQKVHILHNWVDTDYIKPGERINQFRADHNLEDEFVVSFAGVLGYSQDLDIVLGAAEFLKAYEDIVWVIVGDGVETDRLKQKADDMNLASVKFIPMQPRSKYPYVLHASDVGLATLYADVKTPVVPSKILSIMAAGLPVIVAMDLDGDAPSLIDEAECGICIRPEDAQGLADAVLQLYQDENLRNRLGQNGRNYSQQNLSLNACVKRYEELFGGWCA
ncbi:MAG: glycosyltransferase family 4 protein [Chloroflexota bacterium]|nr:glycosyltransferase family 4 protein [Chloroflexota bacterium]